MSCKIVCLCHFHVNPLTLWVVRLLVLFWCKSVNSMSCKVVCKSVFCHFHVNPLTWWIAKLYICYFNITLTQWVSKLYVCLTFWCEFINLVSCKVVGLYLSFWFNFIYLLSYKIVDIYLSISEWHPPPHTFLKKKTKTTYLWKH